MLIAITGADGILLDLRYASVHDLRARRGAVARPDDGLRLGRRRAGRPHGGFVGDGRLKLPVRIAVLSASALALVVPLAGCARDAKPTTFAVPRAAAAEIRMTCPSNTFVGTMTVNCPQPLPRAAPARTGSQ